MTRKAVLLLKAPSTDDSTQDPYFKALSSRGYTAHFVPVLEHGFTNEDALDRTLHEQAVDRYGGVIVTSGRAVEAWARSAQRVAQGADAVSFGWEKLPFYAVGPTTSENLLHMSKQYDVPASLCPGLVLGGDQTGTGERLAHFIISYSNDCSDRSDAASSTLPLLYLTGDKAADTIPRLLDTAGLRVQPLQVYETRASTTFEADFTALLDTATVDEPISWIGFFSPSGARTSLPAIRKRLSLMPQSGVNAPTEAVRLTAIGPTTASHLRNKCGLAVSAMPQMPDAEALAEAIYHCDHEDGRM